jgi:hypothetical protein
MEPVSVGVEEGRRHAQIAGFVLEHPLHFPQAVGDLIVDDFSFDYGGVIHSSSLLL